MNEACLNAKWIRKNMGTPEAQQFTKEVLNHMRERLSDYQEKYGDLYNLEATPAEATSYRLAKHDVKRYPDIKTAAEPGGTSYYTNSSHLPVGYTEDIFAALDVQDELQTLYTSGTVFHAFLGEKLPNWKAAANLVRKIAENYKLPYYTLSPIYSVCKDHGYIAGEVHACPQCGQATEVYSRITGYYRPVQNWNDGKTQEYHDRKSYNIEKSILTHEGAVAHQEEEKACGCAVADGNYLFTTATCPNCKIACSILDKAGVAYDKLLANENAELAEGFGVKQAPTLVVVKDGQASKYAGVSDIKKLLNV
jgi:ribonucleoside-triphosphate reductase